jgi:hypothetical protein
MVSTGIWFQRPGSASIDAMDESVSTPSPSSRSRGRSVLFSCLAGCGILALVMISSCVGFVWWLNRPGELLEPSRLRDADTTGYVEWTLRLEDPGTEALVEDIFAAIRQIQQRAPNALPPAIENVLRDYQTRRNERQFRELFPCVMAWNVIGGESPEDELHVFTVSVAKLGNRLLLMDWIVGMFIGRSPDVDVVKYGDEKIYHLPREGSAFFLRRSDFFFTTDLEAAKRVVDRIQPGVNAPAPEATRLDRMLNSLPEQRPLLGASTNAHGETRRLFELFAGTADHEVLDGLPWEDVEGVSLSGGFTKESSFEATLDLLLDTQRWTERETEALAGVLKRALDSDAIPVGIEVETRPDRVQFVFDVEDLPGLLRHRVALDVNP